MVSSLAQPLSAIFLVRLLAAVGAVSVCKPGQCTEQALLDASESDSEETYPDDRLCQRSGDSWKVPKRRMSTAAFVKKKTDDVAKLISALSARVNGLSVDSDVDYDDDDFRKLSKEQP